MTDLTHDYSALSTLAECAQKFDFQYRQRLGSLEGDPPYLHAGSAGHEALHTLYTRAWDLDEALYVLRQAWGSYQPPQVGKWAYLTLGHMEIVIERYFADRSENPTALESNAQAVLDSRASAEEAIVFDWANARGEILRLGGKPDLPTLMGTERRIVDNKFTTGWVNEFWAKKFTLGHQFRIYCAMMQAETGERFEGAYVNAIYIGEKAGDPPEAWRTRKSVPNALFGPYNYDPAKLEETWSWASALMRTRNLYEEIGVWPQNEQACGNYGGCPYLELCERSPKVRGAIARMKYRRWEPEGVLVSGADRNSREAGAA